MRQYRVKQVWDSDRDRFIYHIQRKWLGMWWTRPFKGEKENFIFNIKEEYSSKEKAYEAIKKIQLEYEELKHKKVKKKTKKTVYFYPEDGEAKRNLLNL